MNKNKEALYTLIKLKNYLFADPFEKRPLPTTVEIKGALDIIQELVNEKENQSQKSSTEMFEEEKFRKLDYEMYEKSNMDVFNGQFITVVFYKDEKECELQQYQFDKNIGLTPKTIEAMYFYMKEKGWLE